MLGTAIGMGMEVRACVSPLNIPQLHFSSAFFGSLHNIALNALNSLCYHFSIDLSFISDLANNFDGISTI